MKREQKSWRGRGERRKGGKEWEEKKEGNEKKNEDKFCHKLSSPLQQPD